jgi:murein DD-endopeptidase MepM/ murein hydrolase activator NlpD
MLGAAPPAGTPVTVVLGTKTGITRPIERVAYRAGLGLKLELARDSGGTLQLIRQPIAIDTTPLRVRGRAGSGIYWSLRAAGASPQAAAEYLRALVAEIDVGSEIGPDDQFDLVIASRRAATGERQMGPLLLAALDRRGASDLQLVRWRTGGRTGGGIGWVEAGSIDRPASQSAGMAWPVAARITSGFGPRVHPILRFARMHRGVDFGARWGSPIVAAADGQVTMAGWAGGYGRQVRIAHPGGIATSYSHMSSMAVAPGTHVRQGQLIGYVGSGCSSPPRRLSTRRKWRHSRPG